MGCSSRSYIFSGVRILIQRPRQEVALQTEMDRNGPKWTEMSRNGPEWSEMDRNGVAVSSVLEYKVYTKHKTYIGDPPGTSFVKEFQLGDKFRDG